MNQLVLDNKTLCDLECILDGYYAPLTSFMNEYDWKNVCENMHLTNGEFFPLPINLAIDKNCVNLGDIIKLVDSTNYPLAEIEINNIYEPDIQWECLKAYGTIDTNHPFVQYKQNHINKCYVSGPLKKINKIRHYDFIEDRLTPEKVKKIFKEKKWEIIVGFQTRNPMHKSHFELTRYALKEAGEGSKLFLNPVVGETQDVDIDYFTRTQCYKALLNKYEENQVLLGLLPLSMRMAGPKEACLHALIRKNYGCTHFIVGRDHAGPSFKTKEGKNFYDPYEAQVLLEKYSKEIGIIPIISKEIIYNSTKNIYQPIDEIEKDDKIMTLSGTQQRHLLKTGQEIPSWFSFPEIIEILKKSVKKRGICYSMIGLSGSGKSTAANILKILILEEYPHKEVTILDGDIFRTLTSNKKFTKQDRENNIKILAYIACEIVKHGGIVICANISPYNYLRLENRKLIESNDGKYIEIYINPGLNVCESRDVKGLYKLAREGKIENFTGISDVFDEPTNNDLEINEVENEETLLKLKNLVKLI